MPPRIHAPELPPNLEWFNTEKPLTIAEQRGKVVLLDFWTYCCINCMHILPDLAYLEQKYPDSLTVIGLHSPKFPNERVGQQVQKAINRYQIQHPVAHDPAFLVWQMYGIRAWPSIIFIDPEGYVLGVLSGEGRREQLDQLIADQLAQAAQKGMRVHSPLPVKLTPEPETVLKFPGKIHATADHLYISDSGRHRVLETDWQGHVKRCFGQGEAGFNDGSETQAQFNEPQGLVKVDNILYVADRKNHALRAIDLATGQVTTCAGTGEQGRYTQISKPLQTALNSPWDVAYHDKQLYIAMAGPHQIWSLNLTTQTLDVYAGSGREDIVDGHPKQAAFAQPSGLSIGENILYVADSETSAIRAIQLQNGHTTTLIGQGLFEFGDRDGAISQARLQHVLGVVYAAQQQGLWIADTYNSKIKWLDLQQQQIVSVDLQIKLDEPGGLSLYENILWIANTNAHQIVFYDIITQHTEILELS